MTLNPKTLNPKTLILKTVNPKTLNPVGPPASPGAGLEDHLEDVLAPDDVGDVPAGGQLRPRGRVVPVLFVVFMCLMYYSV